MEQNSSIESRYRTLLSRMEAVRSVSPAAADSVSLVAVSKTQPEEAILALLRGGHRIFGENKVQEAAGKWPKLREHYADIELHLIGSLQSNKAKDALELFDVIETIDRPSLADALAKERGKSALRCKQFLVQVNIGEEPQKGGVEIAQLDALLKHCASVQLPISGLMCVPPADTNPSPYFALLRTLAQHHGLQKISMGMSGDFEAAIRLGATHIRVGTALFGERQNAA